jgi:hypothetical protein
MRRIIGFLPALVGLVYACVPASIQQTSLVKPVAGVTMPAHVQRLAVAEFADKRSDTSVYPNPAPELQEKIINGLVMKNIDVIERTHMAKILQEQALGQTGILDSQTAAKVGTVLGVDAVLVGEVLDYGKIITPVAKLDFVCRLIDARSGKILFALQVNARKTNMNYPFELHREVIEEAAERTLSSIQR